MHYILLVSSVTLCNQTSQIYALSFYLGQVVKGSFIPQSILRSAKIRSLVACNDRSRTILGYVSSSGN